jgi:CheY-like chemotaxis protein
LWWRVDYELVCRFIVFGLSLLLLFWTAGIVLAADDSAVIRKLLSKYLTDLKCPHHICCDGAEALAWFREHHSDCAAIITDLEMPRMGGDGLIQSAQVIDASVPCFIVSGNALSPSNLPKGTRRAIVKPLSASMLHGIVMEVLTLQSNNR